MQLTNKVAFITGGASGLGAETARFLNQHGVHIALFDRDLSHLQPLAQELQGLAFSGDVADEQAVTAAIVQTVNKWQGIHILVNCAGIADAGRIVSKKGPLPLEEFVDVIQVNLVGTFNVMRLIAAQILKQTPISDDGERGVIINTASVSAYEGQIGQAAYSASKGGIIGLTLPAAREFAEFGLRVMTIAPGVMHTPMVAKMPEKVQQSLIAAVPFPQRFGKPVEFAKLVAHIVENSYLNGSVIRLDAAMPYRIKLVR